MQSRQRKGKIEINHNQVPNLPSPEMSNYSRPHIAQCMSRLMTLRRNSTVTVMADDNSRKTGIQFAEGVLRLANGLTQLGLKPGDVVAISALNSDSYLEWLLAVSSVGGIAAPFNCRWSLEEAKLAMEEVKPTMLVTDRTCNHWHLKFQTHVSWHVCMSGPVESHGSFDVLTADSLRLHSSLVLYSVRLIWAPENAAIICFTSGTSGKPKGVTLSHSALLVQSLAKLALVGFSEDDIYLHTAPLCHIGGISSALAMLLVGGCHIFIPKFEAKSALVVMERHNVTSFITVPAIMSDLISSARTKEAITQFKTVKKILNGGGGLVQEFVENAAGVFPRAKLISTYGMTETSSTLTFMTLYDPNNSSCTQQHWKTNDINLNSDPQFGGVCVGKPAPHVELKISFVDSSQSGRILTRGPHVMLGYWGEISTNASSSVDKDWFDTGDIGQLDDCGNLWLIGRSSGRIKSGGENVYPEEVEAVILQHPGISRVVVVGLPDSRLTEVVVAYIQLEDNWQWIDPGSTDLMNKKDNYLCHEILQQFCKDKNLTRYKIPRNMVLWKSPLPATTTGKLRREEFKKQALHHWQTSKL